MDCLSSSVVRSDEIDVQPLVVGIVVGEPEQRLAAGRGVLGLQHQPGEHEGATPSQRERAGLLVPGEDRERIGRPHAPSIFDYVNHPCVPRPGRIRRHAGAPRRTSCGVRHAERVSRGEKAMQDWL